MQMMIRGKKLVRVKPQWQTALKAHIGNHLGKLGSSSYRACRLLRGLELNQGWLPVRSLYNTEAILLNNKMLLHKERKGKGSTSTSHYWVSTIPTQPREPHVLTIPRHDG